MPERGSQARRGRGHHATPGPRWTGRLVATPPSAVMATTELVDLNAPGTQSSPPVAAANTTTELVDLDPPAAQLLDATSTPGPHTAVESTLVDLTPEEIAPCVRPSPFAPPRKSWRDPRVAPAARRGEVVTDHEESRTSRDTSGEGLDLPGESREVFRSLGLDDSFLRSVAEARVVKVSIPFIREDVGWEARIFPWEALLSAATKPWRDNAPLFIVRHLKRELDNRPATSEDVLYVQSVPAKLRYWDFESERQRIETALPRSSPGTGRSTTRAKRSR